MNLRVVFCACRRIFVDFLQSTPSSPSSPPFLFAFRHCLDCCCVFQLRSQANANDFSAERQKYLKRNLRLNGLFIVSNRQRNVRIFVCYGSYCYPKRIVNNETELELEREKYTLFRCRISAGNFQLSLPLSPSIHTLFVVRAY